MNRTFAARLATLGIPAELRLLEGAGHTFDTVAAGLPPAVQFLAAAFAAPPPAPLPP